MRSLKKILASPYGPVIVCTVLFSALVSMLALAVSHAK